jgi:hypothetical protein
MESIGTKPRDGIERQALAPGRGALSRPRPMGEVQETGSN